MCGAKRELFGGCCWDETGVVGVCCCYFEGVISEGKNGECIKMLLGGIFGSEMLAYIAKKV